MRSFPNSDEMETLKVRNNAIHVSYDSKESRVRKTLTIGDMGSSLQSLVFHQMRSNLEVLRILKLGSFTNDDGDAEDDAMSFYPRMSQLCRFVQYA